MNRHYYGSNPFREDEDEEPVEELGSELPFTLEDRMDAAVANRPRRFILDIYGIPCTED